MTMVKTMSIQRWQCHFLAAVVMVLAVSTDGFRPIQPSNHRVSGFRIRQPRVEAPLDSSSSTSWYQSQPTTVRTTTTTITTATTATTAATSEQHPQSTHNLRKLSALAMLTTFLASSLIVPPVLPTTTTTTAAATTSVASVATSPLDTQVNTINHNQPSANVDGRDDNRGFRDTPFIQNRMLHYGVYCGPGPADAFSGAPAVDSVDRVCQRHDQEYHMCLQDLQSNPSSPVNRLPLPLPLPLPAFINQFVAVRGFLPPPLTHAMHTLFPTYLTCVHSADRGLVAGLHAVEDGGLLPAWWADTRRAPVNAEGARGYDEACVLGLPSTDRATSGLRLGRIIHEVALQVGGLWTVEGALAAPYPGTLSSRETQTDTDTDTTTTSGGLCLVSSRGMFLTGALDLFMTDLAADDATMATTTTLVTADASTSDTTQSAASARDSGPRLNLAPAKPYPAHPAPEPESTSGPDPFLFMRPFSSPYGGPTHQLSTLMFFRD